MFLAVAVRQGKILVDADLAVAVADAYLCLGVDAIEIHLHLEHVLLVVGFHAHFAEA